jgi:hypothetical protein
VAEPRIHDEPALLTGAPRFPNATNVPFAGFNNKYAGSCCYVVGRGPTLFDYEELAQVSEPIFFLNDAVCLEKYARSETFFFAHDTKMLVWLNGAMRATAVLPIDGPIVFDPRRDLRHAGAVVFYHWREENREDLLRMTRDQIAASKELFTHTGTIHSLIHFVWFCGFKRVVFIGCDGINRREIDRCAVPVANGYDVRLQNLSQTSPWWHYTTIRKVQDRLTSTFGLETEFRGTPPLLK